MYRSQVLKSSRFRLFNLKTKECSTFCGIPNSNGFKNGSFEESQFSSPIGIVYSSHRNCCYLSEQGNHLIRIIDLKNKTVSNLVGKPETKGSSGNLMCVCEKKRRLMN